MAERELLVDLSQIDFDKPVATIDDIRRLNPQRFEMEQLTAIVHLDLENKLIIGYKDVSADEYWVRGHMPDYPLIFRVRQSFKGPTLPVPEIPTAVEAELSRLELGQRVKPGHQPAVY